MIAWVHDIEVVVSWSGDSLQWLLFWTIGLKGALWYHLLGFPLWLRYLPDAREPPSLKLLMVMLICIDLV